MDVYLAGNSGYMSFILPTIRELHPNTLESFAYCNKYTDEMRNLSNKFMLDSGAFSYLNGKGHNGVDWDKYVSEYISYICDNGISLYFELDIDSIVGYDRVREFRHRMERECPTPPIPVWHKSRGLDDFKQMCKDYDYVAIGGIVSKEIVPTDYSALSIFINIAHRNDAKIHGLGFMNLKWLPKLHFDSVDGTSWLSGTQYKHLYRFNGTTITRINVDPNMRMKDYKIIAIHNFTEWCKFAVYAERNLRGEYMRVFISCCKPKVNDDDIHPACELYTSSLFRRRMEYARLIADDKDIFILSAKYGLIPQVAPIARYDITLRDMSKQERLTWANKTIAQSKELGIKKHETIYFLTGKIYSEYLMKYFENNVYFVESRGYFDIASYNDAIARLRGKRL